MQAQITNKLQLDKIAKKVWTTSTVLIPNDLLEYYKIRCKFFKKRREYLRHLIHTYGRYLNHYNIFPYSTKWKNKYQDKKLGLTDCHFVPNPTDWEELRHLCLAYGPSMCHFFVILLKLEKARWESAGCPAIFCEKTPKIRKKKFKKNRKNHPKVSKTLKHRNSDKQFSENAKIIVKDLLNPASKTIVYRSIDFDKLELLRIGWVSQ